LYEKTRKKATLKLFLYKSNLYKAHLLIDPYAIRENLIPDCIDDRMKHVKVISLTTQIPRILLQAVAPLFFFFFPLV
jgi:hypothetical protein